MQTVVRVLMQLIRNTIDKTPIDAESVAGELADPSFRTVFFRLANGHDVAHLAALSLQNNGLLPHDEWGDTLQKTAFVAMLRYERQQQEQKRIFDLFEREHIPFIPIKGGEIARYYPEPWWRTSCDIDILIHPEDTARACAALEEQLQYGGKQTHYHDISLYSQNKAVLLELHFSLQETDDQMDGLLGRAWDYAAPLTDGGYRYRLTEEYALFYLLAHTAHHFISGGCGARPMLDVWILRQKSAYDPAQLDALLEQAHLQKFYALVGKLIDRWFGTEEYEDDRLVWSAEHYILEGGVFGNTTNRATLEQVKHGGKAQAIWHQLFLPRERLARYYPIMRRHPWMLPFCQIARWTRLLHRENRQAAQIKFKENQGITEQDKKIATLFLNELDLHR